MQAFWAWLKAPTSHAQSRLPSVSDEFEPSGHTVHSPSAFVRPSGDDHVPSGQRRRSPASMHSYRPGEKSRPALHSQKFEPERGMVELSGHG